MKHTVKIISVLLALVLLLVPALSVTALAGDSENRDYPIIEIPGFMSTDIYADANDAEAGLLYPISADYILGYVKELLPSIAKLMLTKNWTKFGEESTPVLSEMLGVQNLDTNGEASNGSGAIFNYPAPEKISKRSIVSFRYDWRTDPFLVAQQLNDFVEYVCECSGSDKVCITCHSLGGVMALTYITVYGDDRIQSLCMNSTAVYGETYNGELMTGQIVLDADSLFEYLKYAMDGNEYEELIVGLLKLLDDMHLTDFVCKNANYIVEKMGKYWIPEVVVPMFAYWPSIWSMIPDEYLQQAKNYIFGEVLAGNGVDYSALLAKIDAFDAVRNNKVETLNRINENANLYVIARYGYCSPCCTPTWYSLSDGTIDVKYASYGAKAADYGTVFTDEYLASADPEFISPDHTVDASSVLFPEQTWFIKNAGHSISPNCMDTMFYDLLEYDGQATVDTFEKYPRFLIYSYDDSSLTPDTTAPAEKVTGWAAFIESVRNYFRLPILIFKALFGLIINK